MQHCQVSPDRLAAAPAEQPEARPASGCHRSSNGGIGNAGRAADSNAGVDAALAELAGMDIPTLRSAWRRLYRSEAPPRLGRALLELVIAWKLQEQALGGLSATAKRQLGQLASLLASKTELPKLRQQRLKPGARLVRRWGGTTHEVTVAEDGFSWNGRRWASLSVIAREITGARWSGPRFFGLRTEEARRSTPARQDTAGQGAADA